MNKRIRKKHKWLGVKRAGANYCANEIARHIGRKILYSGITPKPSYILNVRRYVRWFFHHSSEEAWTKRVAPIIPDVYFRLRWLQKYGDQIDVSNVTYGFLDIEVDDPQSMAYRIRSYEEYGATGKSLSQEEE